LPLRGTTAMMTLYGLNRDEELRRSAYMNLVGGRRGMWPGDAVSVYKGTWQ